MASIEMHNVRTTRYDVVHDGEVVLETFDYYRASTEMDALNGGETARTRIAEFIRQWEYKRDQRANYNDTVHEVHNDPATEVGAVLTIADIKSLLEA